MPTERSNAEKRGRPSEATLMALRRLNDLDVRFYEQVRQSGEGILLGDLACCDWVRQSGTPSFFLLWAT